MPKRRRNGPGVFLSAVGAVVLLSGLLTFLALPAARRMDEKAADQSDTAVGDRRQASVRSGAWATVGVGAAFLGTGVFLLAKKREQKGG